MSKFDNLSMPKLLEKAQQMQKQLQEIQEKVAKLEVEGRAGGGIVKVKMSGKHEIKSIEADLKAFANITPQDFQLLRDLIIAACNHANELIENKLRDEMGGLAGFNLPGSLDETER